MSPRESKCLANSYAVALKLIGFCESFNRSVVFFCDFTERVAFDYGVACTVCYRCFFSYWNRACCCLSSFAWGCELRF